MPTSSPPMRGACGRRSAPRAGRVTVIVALVGALTFVNVVGVKRAIRALDAADPAQGAASGRARHLGPVPCRRRPSRAGPACRRSRRFEASALVLLYAFVGFENAVGAGRGDRQSRPQHPARLDLSPSPGPPRSISSFSSAYAAVMPARGRRPPRRSPLIAEALIGPAGAIILSAHRSGLGRRQCRRLDDLDARASPTPWPAQGTLPALVRQGQPALRHAGQFDPVPGRWPALALAISGSFVWLAIVSTLSRLFVYGASIAALPKAQARARLSCAA